MPTFQSKDGISAIQEVADIKRLTDLSLCMQETVGCRYVEPDFAVLLQCPLKSFAIEKYKRVGNTASSIPHGIITALGTLSELEALTIIRVNSSEGLINLLTNDRFPNLQYLNVHLNKKLDFGKLTKLTFLRVSGSAAKTNVDLSSLTELRALQVRGRDTVLKLNSGCRYLKWLLLSGVIEIDGDRTCRDSLSFIWKRNEIRRCEKIPESKATFASSCQIRLRNRNPGQRGSAIRFLCSLQRNSVTSRESARRHLPRHSNVAYGSADATS